MSKWWSGKFLTCPVCKKEFYKPPSRIKRGDKCCSKKCGYVYRGQPNTGRTHFKKGMVPWNKGKNGYMGANRTSFKKGQQSWNAGTGSMTEDMQIRSSKEYIEWRNWVFKRDNYTCQSCGVIGGTVNAHHVIYFKDDKNGRLDRDNGITLCENCHKETHTTSFKSQWACRWAPTLGDLEDTHEKIWGTVKYTERHKYNPTVFFGLYSFNDFYTLWRHKGNKYILWAGSDISRFINGYWLEDTADGLKLDPKVLANWINKHCESWVENEVEAEALGKFGIQSYVCPSFMGNIDNYKISYQYSDKPKMYASVSGDDFLLYGWDKIEKLAYENPHVEFHLYGNTKPWNTLKQNIIVHGRVPKERMNEEIKQMQGGLRMVEFDGFSEITAKSMLWGQWPVSVIKYPHVFTKIPKIFPRRANIDGAVWCRTHVNNFPWNVQND